MTVTISASDLKQLVIKKFVDVKVPEKHAEIVADVLVHANLRNVDSHGVLQIKRYMNRIKKSLINVNPNITVESVTPVVSLVDGDHGMGHVIAVKAIEETIKLARTYGIGVVWVKNSDHFGALSYYMEMVANEDMIGLAFTNANKNVAPFGGYKPFFGTNPIAFGAPVKGHEPVILDMATSTVAFGKILAAMSEGKSIPKDWGLDNNGEPTAIPEEVVALQPISGPKGYGLAMMVDILSGVLTGSPYGKNVPTLESEKYRKLGHFFITINPEMFVGLEAFKNNMKNLVESIQQEEPAKGFKKIMVPGEPESIIKKERLVDGIPITKSIYDYLQSTEG